MKSQAAKFYVVNAGRGRSTHVMRSTSAHIPNQNSFWSVVTGIYPTPKRTLCGLVATRYVDVFTPGEATCRECRRRWELATAPPAG